jgi:hypothetical protein
MGHLTALADNPAAARELALRARRVLGSDQVGSGLIGSDQV